MPLDINILELDPKEINESLSREQKRDLLKSLPNTTYLMKVELEGFNKAQSLSIAATLLLGLVLRNRTPNSNPGLSPEDFAELVGCATPTTIDELTYYLREPSITMDALPN